MAPQQRLGIWPQWRDRPGRDCDHPPARPGQDMTPCIANINERLT